MEFGLLELLIDLLIELSFLHFRYKNINNCNMEIANELFFLLFIYYKNELISFLVSLCVFIKFLFISLIIYSSRVLYC